MGTATLTIDRNALAANWKALDGFSRGETGAVVKANGYGLDAAIVAQAFAKAGARTFFVAVAEEGNAVREALGPGPEIFVFSGHMEGDAASLKAGALTPLLNSPEQIQRHFSALPDHAFGLQLDTGMNRLGLEPAQWAEVRGDALARGPRLVMSHLACSDEPDHEMNEVQRASFDDMTAGVAAPRSLAATGGILLGPEFHYDMTRPGIGLYGGFPFSAATPVVRLDVPVIQTREVEAGETVGYGNSWTALSPAKIATISAGYADGLIRAMGASALVFHGETACPVRGRVSMDLITVDVTHLEEVPDSLEVLGPHQGVDDLAEAAGTIGYEILTSLGQRYDKVYL